MRKLSQVLLCQPDYFEVSYSINPWMKPGPINLLKARQQWQNLQQTLKYLQIKVEVISQQPNVPDMVFAVDQGLVKDNQVLLASFHYSERQPETKFYQQWFTEQGYQVSTTDGASFEGGEYLRWGENYFVGTGFRTESAAVPIIKNFLNTQVIELELIDPRFYHLDMCLLPLSETQVLYYPAAFSPSSVALLQQEVPDLIEMSEEEAMMFGANSLVIEQTVLLSAYNLSLSQKLSQLGYQPLTVDVSEFSKAGGGIHCLVMPLKYQESALKESYDRVDIRKSI